MANMLRYLALLNAGVWLGASGFMIIVAYTIFTTPEMDAALQSGPEKGLAGNIFFLEKFFNLFFQTLSESIYLFYSR